MNISYIQNKYVLAKFLNTKANLQGNAQKGQNRYSIKQDHGMWV